MDAEVNAEADEQHREGNGNQIETADGQRRESSGPDQADQQRDDHRENQAAGPEADRKQQGHQQ